MFLVTGLQARTLLEQAHAFTIDDVLIATAWTTLIAIADTIYLDVSGNVSFPRWLSPRLRKRDPSPPCKRPSFSPLPAYAGRRFGSPLRLQFLHDSQPKPFPHRDLILFLSLSASSSSRWLAKA